MKETLPDRLSQTEPLKRLSEMISELSELQGQLLDIKQALIERELEKLSSYSSPTKTPDISLPF
ncbi:MAG: hypothetical protein ACRDEA_10950 [Microcystaceae cyanobacterium]